MITIEQIHEPRVMDDLHRFQLLRVRNQSQETFGEYLLRMHAERMKKHEERLKKVAEMAKRFKRLKVQALILTNETPPQWEESWTFVQSSEILAKGLLGASIDKFKTCMPQILKLEFHVVSGDERVEFYNDIKEAL